MFLFTCNAKRHGFTLIELLIVVAIIAILAAIAVPNFLEAQSRAKVSRAKADMRSLATAIESYAVDNNNYPPPRHQSDSYTGSDKYCYYLFFSDPGRVYPGVPWLSTPVAYISSYPQQSNIIRRRINQGNAGYDNFSYFFINFKGAAQDQDFLDACHSDGLQLGSGPRKLQAPMPINVIGGGYAGIKSFSDWLLVGVGPSGVMDLDSPENLPSGYGHGTSSIFMTFRQNAGQPAGTYLEGWRTGWWKAYDPTNGTMSLGFILRTQSGTPGE